MSGYLLGFFLGFALPLIIVGVPYVIWGPKITQARPATTHHHDT